MPGFTGALMTAALDDLGFTHVVWLPDSMLGAWERDLERSSRLSLIRVCREGEAWAIAAGLFIGGRQPLVVLQNTGLFESGDSLRNALFDLKLPLYALVGYRSYLVANSADTAKKFTEPFVTSWGLDHVLLMGDNDLPKLADHCRDCRERSAPGVALLAEGRG